MYNLSPAKVQEVEVRLLLGIRSGGRSQLVEPLLLEGNCR